jgi:ABC-type transport system involved in multi-copper enzyme maturation permease subunit
MDGANMNAIQKLVLHELRLTWREPRFWLPFALPPLFLLVAQIAQNIGSLYLFLMGAIMSITGVTLAADTFAGERERNSLETLLSLPVPFSTIFTAKVIALLPFPFVLSCVFQVISWALIPGAPVSLLFQAFAFGIFSTLALSGFGVLISLRSETVRSAQIGALLVFPVLAAVPFAMRGGTFLLLYSVACTLCYFLTLWLAIKTKTRY